MLKTVQHLSQHQKLSPQLIQAQMLLTVPAIELEDKIKEQLEKNPALEETKLDDSFEDNNFILRKYQPSYSDRRNPDDKQDVDNRNEFLINKYSNHAETPLEQLHSSGFSEIEQSIGEEILGSLNDDGYLTCTVEEIKDDLSRRLELDVSLEQIERVLNLIQHFEPVGLASRNLQECLVIQLKETNHTNQKLRDIAIKVILDDFENFRTRRYEALAEKYLISIEDVNHIYEMIHRLDPKPGRIFATPYNNSSIYPDFIVTKTDEGLKVELTDSFIPGLKLNESYVKLYQDNNSKETREFLKQNIYSAKSFIEAVRHRRITMLNVMKAIVNKQKDFFMKMGGDILPMFEKDIAEEVRMDISTVSRVVNNKYVQTDFGIYELKHFFSRGLHSDSGEDISNKVVKEEIRKLFDSEDKSKPYSDDAITVILNKRGLNIARRTVAKYREAMKIPKATLRRRIKSEKE